MLGQVALLKRFDMVSREPSLETLTVFLNVRPEAAKLVVWRVGLRASKESDRGVPNYSVQRRALRAAADAER
jgi:hypothetical protein